MSSLIESTSVTKPASPNFVNLEPAPLPGLMLFPRFVSNSTQTLLMKKSKRCKGWRISHNDTDKTLMTIQDIVTGEIMGGRVYALHGTSTDQRLCYMKFVNSKQYHGYEVGEDDFTLGTNIIFRTEVHRHLGQKGASLIFANAVEGGTFRQLEFKYCSSSPVHRGLILFQGQTVAVILGGKLKGKSRYTLMIAPGLDSSLAVIFTKVLHYTIKHLH